MTIGVYTEDITPDELEKLLASAEQDYATMMGRGFARRLVYDMRAARAEITRLREIAKAVARDDGDRYQCSFCDAEEPTGKLVRPSELGHAPDCAWVAARKLAGVDQ